MSKEAEKGRALSHGFGEDRRDDKSVAPSAVERSITPHPDSLALVRLIELLKAMDMQATRITRMEGNEEVIEGYKFNTGCWHRILGTIAGHEACAWLRTPEGQQRVAESAERARQTIEELERARRIDPKILNERFTHSSSAQSATGELSLLREIRDRLNKVDTEIAVRALGNHLLNRLNEAADSGATRK